MSNNYEWFRYYISINSRLTVRIGNDESVYVVGKGDINILSLDGHPSNILHVPKIKYNLFSVGAALDKGLKLESRSTVCKWLKNGYVVAVGEIKNKLYQKRFTVLKLSDEIIHADLCGPMAEKSTGGSLYYLLLKDNFSHWKGICLLKGKSGVATNIEDIFKKGAKHLTGCRQCRSCD
ncbi:hypothetical protein PR048_033138 [Dryococelus australis]|uniref:Retrovirus-related Pol polyprotein from transposon TNT 1-94-like beta-barrel domain-containing protein n=1 Tax=Dryococelus australis TaxID=614101 RepID=A0ABQ9G2S0_9NEOP|nr:hypothetical protein PR048_033138 [Dryococelus australis]